MGTNVRQNIVTNGLVLYLDAGSRMSYVSGSTTWNDLSGNNYTGSLINGPTFSSVNQGGIIFDGVNDYVTLGNVFNDVMSGANKQFTYTCAFIASSTANQHLFGKYADGATGANERQFAVFVRDLGTGFKIDVNFSTAPTAGANAFRAETIISTNTPYIISVLYDDTQSTSLDKINVWINGILSPKSLQITGVFGPLAASAAEFTIGAQLNPATGVTGLRYTGRVSILNLYSRLLSAQEIVQNYNALKTRFGLT